MIISRKEKLNINTTINTETRDIILVSLKVYQKPDKVHNDRYHIDVSLLLLYLMYRINSNVYLNVFIFFMNISVQLFCSSHKRYDLKHALFNSSYVNESWCPPS